jgi:hypothetical protein
MIINMVTFAARDVHYIDRTLEFLAESDGRDIPINLILGSYDTSHVDKYRGKVNLVLWNESAEGDSIPGDLRRSCSINAIRSMRYGDDDYCLCCEDDVGFKPDWYSQLKLTIEEIEEQEYILGLSQATDEPTDKRYAPHTRVHLVGAQAIFYVGKKLRHAVARFVHENMRRGMNDNLVGEYGKKYSHLYNTVPTLAWHAGQVSSFSRRQKPKS